MLKIVLVSVLGFLSVLASRANAETLTGRVTVIDGDTIKIGDEHIDLLDIDAPEIGQLCFMDAQDPFGSAWACGEQAAVALSTWIQGRDVLCDVTSGEEYGHWSGQCTVGGQDMGEWLAENGWAVPDRSCQSDSIRQAAGRAMSADRGIWTSSFTLPWEWRSTH